MKKLLSIGIILVLSISFVSAFSILDFMRSNLFYGLASSNAEPIVELNIPVENQVVNNPVLFTWRYADPENDDLLYSIIQIDRDRNFYNPTNYQIPLEREFKFSLEEEGEYHWRVLVVNQFDEKLSESQNFYFDPNKKVCSDGTEFYKCGINKPNYCDGGVLKSDCVRCGCPENGICGKNGLCEILTCSDGTDYGSCSRNKPFFCNKGDLTEVCSLCGCEEGLECTSEGKCVEEETVVNIEPVVMEKRSLLQRIADFFKRLFR